MQTLFLRIVRCSMNSDQRKLLSTFEVRVDELIRYCDSLKKEVKLLREQLTEKQVEVELLTDRLNILETDNELLKLAKTFTSNPEEMEKAKKRISKLVREVDKCIALLNE